MDKKVVDSSLNDMKMSIKLLPLLAGAIRKLRVQKQEDPEAPTQEAPKAALPAHLPEPRYTQNKWEVSPNG